MRISGRKGLAVLAIGLAVAAGVALARSGLGFLRNPAAAAASRALGVPVTVRGAFRIDPGAVTRLEAGDIRIGRPDGSGGGPAGRIGRLVVAVRLASLLRGPIELPHLRLGHVRLVLPAPKPAAAGEPAPGRRAGALPRLDDVEIADLEIAGRAAGEGRRVRIERARLFEDTAGILHLAVAGNALGAPLELSGRIGPFEALTSGAPVRQDLRFRAGTVRGRLRGRTVSLATLAGADLEAEVRGEALGEVWRLLAAAGITVGGASDLSGPFAVTAGIHPGRGRALELRAALDTTLAAATVSGTVTPGAPPALDLRFTAEGRDAGALSRTFGGPAVPAEEFSLSGGVRAHGFPVELDGLRLRLGRARATVSGTVGPPPGLDGTALDVEADLPDTAPLEAAAGRPLPPGGLRVSGRLELTASRLTVGRFHGTLGTLRFEASGELPRPGGNGHPRAPLDLHVAGPDLAVLSRTAGMAFPALAFDLQTRLVFERLAVTVASLAGRLGPDRLTASGVVRLAPGLAGSSLEARAAGPGAAVLGGLIGLRGLPAGPYRASAILRFPGKGLEVAPLDATVGGHSLRGAVRVAPEGRITVRFDASSGPDASALTAITGLTLPDLPYAVTGALELSQDAVRFDRLAARLGGARVEIRSGTVVKGDAPSLGLELEGEGPDLSVIGAVIGLPDLPAVPWRLGGRVDREPRGTVRLAPLEGTVGRSALRVEGFVEPPRPGWRMALDLTAHGDDPETAVALLEAFGVSGLPGNLGGRPYRAGGGVGHGPGGVTFDRLKLTLGPVTVTADGVLGPPSNPAGTALVLRGRAGSPIAVPAGGAPVTLEGAAAEVRLGPGALDGGTAYALTGTVRARRLVLEPSADREDGAADGAAASAPAADRRGVPERVIPDRPVPFLAARTVSLDVTAALGELDTPYVRLQDLEASVRWTADGLRVAGFHARDRTGGTVGGAFGLTREGGVPAVRIAAAVNDIPVDLSKGAIPRSGWPRLALRAELEGSGAAVRDLAAAASGRFVLSLGRGKLESGLLDTIGGSIGVQLVEALNPFHRAERVTELECLTVVGRLEAGRLTLDPMGLKTARVVTVGSGTVDLATERLDITFQTKSRRGLGLSASTVTDNFVKLGGTLAKPAIRLRPLRAAASTGLAVVTGGLSILAKGLWNRVSSEADLCATMREAGEALWETPPERSDGPPGTDPG